MRSNFPAALEAYQSIRPLLDKNGSSSSALVLIVRLTGLAALTSSAASAGNDKPAAAKAARRTIMILFMRRILLQREREGSPRDEHLVRVYHLQKVPPLANWRNRGMQREVETHSDAVHFVGAVRRGPALDLPRQRKEGV